MSDATVERAGAKVTLSLRVLGRRADGYHELDALIAIVDEPHDELSIIEGAHDSELVVEPVGAAPVDETNLVSKARAALGSTVGLRLRKGIPAEAGLGGGSADAAATLRLLSAAAPGGELDEVATSLGADVPVCMHAGIWRMRGIGDVLEPVARPTEPLHLVLATPPFGCSTADVYRAWDDLGGPESSRSLAPSRAWALATGDDRPWRNDLEPAALQAQPALAEFRDAFATIAGAEPLLCGSGSTHFVRAPTRDDACRIADRVRNELDTRCVAVATVGRTVAP